MRKFISISLLFFMCLVLFSCKTSDSDILRDVQSKFDQDSILNIEFSVENGVVVLNGHVKDEKTKQKLETTTQQSKYVKRVVNNLIIIETDSIAIGNF